MAVNTKAQLTKEAIIIARVCFFDLKYFAATSEANGTEMSPAMRASPLRPKLRFTFISLRFPVEDFCFPNLYFRLLSTQLKNLSPL